MPLAALGELVAASSTAAVTVNGPHLVATVTQVAVTAAAVVYGAYLSDEMIRGTKIEDKTDILQFDGVDVTKYRIFQEAEVEKAIQFARTAHLGQMRKTGEPYVTHCIHTARILAALVPAQGQQAIDTIVAGILHDVVDDTGCTLADVKQNFGENVARLVEGVSKLSNINQLLRRHRRTSAEKNSTPNGLSPADVDSLRMMLLGMVNDPRVVLIKLADRLHNMRTIYPLPPAKASAVAQETLAVWCSLASRLGVWAVKAELEDLCFAVLRPRIFRQLRAELAAMWSPPDDWRQQRRMKRSKRWLASAAENMEDSLRRDPEDEEEISMKELLEAVVPFDVLLDRSRRSCGLGSTSSDTERKAKVVRDAEVALAALDKCEEALDKELLITTPYVPGMEVMLSGRLKSVYSAYCKMRRKKVTLDQVFDARALRVVVGDGGGKMSESAVEGCYSLLNVVHSLWPPVSGEFDDYIVNPKPSGYQSLHTAVIGPDGAALEIQIRTQGMHEYAEFGHAAHWLYKEGDTADFAVQALTSPVGDIATSPVPGVPSNTSSKEYASASSGDNLSSDKQEQYEALEEPSKTSSKLTEHTHQVAISGIMLSNDGSTFGSSSSMLEDRSDDEDLAVRSRDGPLSTSGSFQVEESDEEGVGVLREGKQSGRGPEDANREALADRIPLLPSTWPVAVGQPALRIEEGRLLAAVVVRVDNNGRDLLVAVSFALRAAEAVAAGRNGSQISRWGTYAKLLHKVQSQWWNAPGHGDWSTCMEHYTLCKDGIYHKEDQFGRALPTFIQLLDLNSQEKAEYGEITARVKAGQGVEAWPETVDISEVHVEETAPSTAMRLNNKVRLLRSMLQWEQELRHEAATDGSLAPSARESGEEGEEAVALCEVLIIRWPGGEILRMPRGSEARDAAQQAGAEGRLVMINGRISAPHTVLRDGDLVEIRL